MLDKCYFYRGKVVSVYDGDTCRVDIDLGFGIWKKKETLRLSRINAPEVRGESAAAGKVSRDFLRDLILDKDVVVQTILDTKGKYGRYLAEIWLFNDLNQQWININDKLVENKQAIYQDY